MFCQRPLRNPVNGPRISRSSNRKIATYISCLSMGESIRKPTAMSLVSRTAKREMILSSRPFVKRPLNGLPFLKEQDIGELYYDISNAYGFGGPVSRCDDPDRGPQMLREFNRYFSAYCTEHKIASEFTSLHPLLDRQRLFLDLDVVSATEQKEVVYIDLAVPQEEIWGGLRKGHKSSIKKATKNGVYVEKVQPTSENFSILNRLYYDTMERNKAADRWYFPKEYFRGCYEHLGKERISLFVAYVGSVPAAACILMHAFDTIYYHFSGSDERFYNYCTNNLMVYEAALWAKQKGYKRFFLGGGVSSSSQDSLFIFKSGFSEKRASLYTYGRVHHKQTYEYLCSLKRTHEKATHGSEIKSDYFPLYRR